MLFTQPEFLFLFLPATLLACLLSPRILRNSVLTFASLVFYCAGEGAYVIVLLGAIVFNYIMGIGIDSALTARRKKNMLGVAVAGDLFMILWFKYLGFFVENTNVLLKLFGFGSIEDPQLHLPIGISFFTFQGLSYVIDVYRGVIRPMTNPLHFALYKSLFPQLIAGPIVRAKTVMAEIHDRTIDIEGFAYGARRFAAGLAKKLVIADTVAIGADGAFNASSDHLTMYLAWVGLICYSLQIYYDFSAYSDMAIGIGRMLGFRFLENFRYPYFAQSITEFWRRWHISLSTWFRDYLYIPLGGSRISKRRTYLNLLIVFLLCGFWHGASWTFIVWGLWHGIFLIAERAGLQKWLSWQGRIVRHAYVIAVVLSGWIFFRAPSLSSAAGYFAALVGFGRWQITSSARLGADLWIAMGLGIMFAIPTARWAQALWLGFLRTPGRYRSPLYLAGRLAGTAVMAVNLFVSLVLSAAGTHNPFIYFRF